MGRSFRNTNWTLGLTKVPLVDTYKYLGIEFRSRNLWSAYFSRILAEARGRTADLLWVCRGLPPRCAATMWKALVRPLLEYGAPIWAGEVPQHMVQEAERIQTGFTRSALGLPPGAPSVFVRAELGMDRMQARWDKLRLTYYRSVCRTRPDRILARLARSQRVAISQPGGRGGSSWMRRTRDLLASVQLGQFWDLPSLATGLKKLEWKKLVYFVADRREMHRARVELRARKSLDVYS